MSRFLNVLRIWLMMTSIIASGHSLQSFRDHTFLYEKLYTSKPDLVNGLQARTFGLWTLLSSVVRCLCAIDIHNKTLYYITLWTFFIGMGHFLFELFVFGTMAPTIFILAILTVANTWEGNMNDPGNVPVVKNQTVNKPTPERTTPGSAKTLENQKPQEGEEEEDSKSNKAPTTVQEEHF
ncbi:hypothetical protein MG293_009827 [Ovis ammon polii]|uniref:Ergosterol biosynthetic protein 28 n=1 Tax=Ovis ammon polii TaxID=230172 RepID=A0AAD4U7M0_OVIAM|nr:hypothetical protein MG293_009827 [Ovis ammon polii]KAI4568450.1 hypothetical protein MJT46_008248 [Ovis ammon polii x Ovis aries]